MLHTHAHTQSLRFPIQQNPTQDSVSQSQNVRRSSFTTQSGARPGPAHVFGSDPVARSSSPSAHTRYQQKAFYPEQGVRLSPSTRPKDTLYAFRSGQEEMSVAPRSISYEPVSTVTLFCRSVAAVSSSGTQPSSWLVADHGPLV